MVTSWREGKVKINRIDFQANESVIAEVTNSPSEGIKFFRDKKVSFNVVKCFAKNAKEMKDFVKTRAYYEPSSIKKL